jgi:ABC-type branched-subunit amino acid transport system substrate-binding protein
MKRILTIVLAAIFIVVLILTGCPAKEVETKTLKIGCSLPLNVLDGIAQERFLNVIVKDINESGGWQIGDDKYMIDLIVYNDNWSEIDARANAERLVFEDKVKHIIHLWGDNIILPFLKVTEPNKVLVIGAPATPEPCKPEYKYFFSGTGTELICAGISYACATRCVNELGAKTVVTVNWDNPMGHVRSDLDALVLPKLGLEIKDNLFYTFGTTDYAPLITKALSYNPDVYWGPTVLDQDCVKQFVALHDAGYEGAIEIINLHDQNIQDLVGLIGPEYMEGRVAELWDNRDYQTDPEMKKIMDDYVEEYGTYDSEGALWMSNWFLFKSAVDATQSLDVDVLADYLANSPAPVKTLLGWHVSIARLELGNTRTTSAVDSEYTSIVKDSKLVPLGPVSCETEYQSHILAYDLEDIYQEYWDQYGYPTFPEE